MQDSSSSRSLAPTLAALAAFTLLLFPACARKTPQPEAPSAQKAAEPTRWALSDEAASMYYFLVLQDAKLNRNDQAALLAFQELIKIDPTARVYAESAEYFWNNGNLQQAVSILEAGLVKYPRHADMTILLAYSYYNSERKNEAIALLQDYLTVSPAQGSVRQELANLLIQEGRHAEGLDALDALSKENLSPELRYFRAKALAGLGRYSEAIAEAKRAVETEPFFIRAWAELAYLYDVTKDFVSAEQTYSYLLEIGEDNPDIRLRLIELNIGLNNPNRALEFFQNGPDTLGFTLKTASAFLDEGFHDYAREVLIPLEEGGEVPPEAKLFLAVIAYEKDGDVESALEHLNGIPSGHRLSVNAVKMRLQLLAANGRSDEAVPLAEKAVGKFPADKDMWLIYGELLEDAERPEEALDVLARALKRWPDDTTLLYEQAALFHTLGRENEALAAMEKIITINPDHADALNFAGYVLADRGENLERALLMITRADRLKPNNAYILDSLAWVHFRLGRIDEAWDIIQRAASLSPQEYTVWEHFGDIARKLGLVEEARKGYENALRFAPEDKPSIREKLESL